MLLAAHPYLPDTQLNPPPHAFPVQKFHHLPTVISASLSSSPPKVQTTELSPYYSETDLVGGGGAGFTQWRARNEWRGPDRRGRGGGCAGWLWQMCCRRREPGCTRSAAGGADSAVDDGDAPGLAAVCWTPMRALRPWRSASGSRLGNQREQRL